MSSSDVDSLFDEDRVLMFSPSTACSSASISLRVAVSHRTWSQRQGLQLRRKYYRDISAMRGFGCVASSRISADAIEAIQKPLGNGPIGTVVHGPRCSQSCRIPLVEMLYLVECFALA